MNPGNEWERPTTPHHHVPGGRFEPPTQPPTLPPMHPMPPMPPVPRPPRPPWLLPTIAAAVVVLVAVGGVGAYLVVDRLSGGGGAPPVATATRASRTAPTEAAGPDVCAMLPKEEAERLVPDATVSESSRDGDYTVSFTCNWNNQRISFGEFWRKREIDVRIEQHKGDGAKTGRAMAQNSYEVDYRGGKFGETAKPSLEPDEKEYVSPVKDIEGVGDGAFAQYTWRRDGNLLWYSYGEAHARVGDMTIKVKFQAGQQRKDAEILSNQTVQSITEDNAIREVSGLVKHFAEGVRTWQSQHPGVLAKAAPSPSASATVSPSARPTPSPTVLAAFPADCEAVGEVATRLVPEPTTRARGAQVGADVQTECRWLNLDLPGEGAENKKIRSALITVHRFTNRAGGADETAARSYYASERGGDKNMSESSIGGISWSKVTDLKELGDQAYQVFVKNRHSDVSASSGTVLVRKGAVVVQVDYSGHQRPEKEATNSPKVKLMPEKEAMDGALTLAKAYMAELDRQPAGG
ncbi:hypothetical protein FH608_025130 [Nonomuraea phyllanthi]|uniref:DUF3558 domain-containing protein n=1 Tax=Nonomuraea phyllanthi TaxID=2219224 RepID=A0A5C4W9G9_9ACTN|nr:hypothetical protein [Nonomuraea phyllanthi]KAB8192757.1 hypothetical protein FH608_025130 [Nonomuraea phyllanthi]